MTYTPDEKVGDKFGRLTFLGLAHRNERRVWYWNVSCDCGKQKVVIGSHVRRGIVRSCGCLRDEVASDNFKTHGKSGTKVHKTWKAIRQRCHNPKNPAYDRYGGRGIFVCPEWLDSFDIFFSHVGEPPSADHSLDRIDNEKGYQPGNVRWATWLEQGNNKSNNVRILLAEKDDTLKELCRQKGGDYYRAYNLIVRRKLTPDVAFQILRSSKKAGDRPGLEEPPSTQNLTE